VKPTIGEAEPSIHSHLFRDAASSESDRSGREATFPRPIAESCARFLDGTLFNGEYYQQKVQYQGLRDRSFADMLSSVNEQSSEMQKLLKREGPRYQYGSGCLSDGIIGDWMARIYGIETPLNRGNVHRTLESRY